MIWYRSDVTATKCTKVGEYKGRHNVFRLHLPTGNVTLSAYTEDEMSAWVDALTRASGEREMRVPVTVM